MSQYSAGDDIDGWCTRCRMDLRHRIVAMVGPEPKRVVCLTCDSEHNFRAPKASKKKAPAKRKTGTSTTKKAASKASKTTKSPRTDSTWEELVGDRPTATFRRYSMSTSFKEGDCIDHPKFGPGAVAAIVAPQKISVVFRDGERTLVHAKE